LSAVGVITQQDCAPPAFAFRHQRRYT